MPHLLVAGTTGSGKSVAINTMILSLLYRLTPEQCRLIMVDPKMLELSVYDGIPHLLTPVVTDPKKAVMALKWAVREMEERYRKMSRLGVRNIDGYNAASPQAREKGETISHHGPDRLRPKGTGAPIEESQEIDLTPMPYIVVIVDEMADLMMVAGKEIEGAIQRLAQMARAAGIHLIMATQRPSVDVITGTIKANFPTRISFQVTSKIDSRTILGEQGAEQLLGQGDMLHMAGGGRIARVHGPFVSDEEVEKVVAHLKTQGRPEYLDTVTADEEEDDEEEQDSAVFDKGDMAAEDGNDLYDKAVKVVGSANARQEVLDLLHPAPPRHRLQPRRLAGRADGKGRARSARPTTSASARSIKPPDGDVESGERPSAADLYTKMDSDKDGSVTKSEFVAARPEHASEEEATSFYNSIDTKGTGSITEQQLADSMKNKGGPGGPEGRHMGPPGGAPDMGSQDVALQQLLASLSASAEAEAKAA
jgi:DNA segregation ATPase FtsK/SpoIIIE-like protein